MNNVSVIDYIGVIGDGIGVILSLKLGDSFYEMVYWFNKKDQFLLEIDEQFLEDYNLKSIYDAENFSELIYYINKKVLPSREELYKVYKI